MSIVNEFKIQGGDASLKVTTKPGDDILFISITSGREGHPQIKASERLTKGEVNALINHLTHVEKQMTDIDAEELF